MVYLSIIEISQIDKVQKSKTEHTLNTFLLLPKMKTLRSKSIRIPKETEKN